MPKANGTRKSHDRSKKQDDKDVVISDIRPIDGAGTNEANPDWGATEQYLLRMAPAGFADDIGEMVEDRPNPREISNAVAQQEADEPSSAGLSDMFWAWGQFIDHDLDLTDAAGGAFTPIPVPAGDPQFDPDGTGEAFIPFTRIGYVDGTGEDSPREYVNEITSFLDASMIYGSDAATATALRGEGGTLLLDEQGLLPRDENGGVLAGDVRAGENVALTSLHTLFAREHNRIVEELARIDPDLSDDELYDAARQRVEAEVQAITYNEFLPLLLGENAIGAYEGYDPSVNPGISVEFSTAAFRFGHSLLSAEIERINEDGSTIAAGDLGLRDAFFSPDEITDNGGIAPILRGISEGTAQELDTQVVEDVRSFLFGDPGQGGLDLAALNIQRGRDLGVASYNDLREALSLARAESFSDVTSDVALAAELETLYGDVDSVDAWVGGLAEDPHGDGIVGQTFSTVILDQFLRIRDGDPYWSENSALPQKELDALWSTTLADVIERNSDVDAIQDNVMLAYDRIAGGDDADALTGGDGRELLLGLAGDDDLQGGAGDDQLEGGDGRDRLAGGEGDDVLNGNDGNDTFADSAGNNLIDGGRGKDVLELAGSLDDYTIDFAKKSMLVGNADGGVSEVNDVEYVHFVESGDVFAVKDGALVPADDDPMVADLIDESLVAEAASEISAADINDADLVELQSVGVGDDAAGAGDTAPTDEPLSTDFAVSQPPTIEDDDMRMA